MSSLWRFWRTITTVEGLHSLITSDLIRPWLVPLGISALTMLSGLFSAVPLPYLIAAASFAFASVATGLLRLDEWRARTDVSGKVIFAEPLYATSVEYGVDPPTLKDMRFGLVMMNRAAFPIQYEVEEIHTQFLNRVPPELGYRNRGGEMSAETAAYFHDNVISLAGTPVPEGVAEGKLRFKVAYWRNPKRKFYLERKVTIFAGFDLQRQQTSFEWRFD